MPEIWYNEGRYGTHSPWKNISESAIGVIHKRAHMMMHTTCMPIRLWDYAYTYVCEL